MPTLGVLRCYSCNAKVLYPKGSSDFIKCTRCMTVNELPREIKEYKETLVEEPYYNVYNENGNNSNGNLNPYMKKEFEF